MNTFIVECKDSGKFDDNQIDEIRYGFEHRLTIEQVKVYTVPEFNRIQMYEIHKGFANGLTMEEVKFYAKPKFTMGEMIKIRNLII